MQASHAMSGRARPKSTGRRRPVLLIAAGLASLAAVFAIVHIVTGAGASTATHHARAARAGCAAGSSSARRRNARCLHGRATTRHRARRRVQRVGLPAAAVSMRVYARGLAPVLDQSRSELDRAAVALASSPGLDALGQTCAAYGQQLLVLEQQADGVAYPYAFYTHVSGLHYTMMGIFHDALGALSACNEAAGAGDPSAAGTAVADTQTADQQMRAMDDQVRALETTRTG